jgi:hypothetical protein
MRGSIFNGFRLLIDERSETRLLLGGGIIYMVDRDRIFRFVQKGIPDSDAL